MRPPTTTAPNCIAIYTASESSPVIVAPTTPLLVYILLETPLTVYARRCVSIAVGRGEHDQGVEKASAVYALLGRNDALTSDRGIR